MIDHCISQIKKSHRQETCINYVADALRYLLNNTAEQESRITLNKSLNDLLNPVTKEMEEDNEEKAKAIKNKMCNTLAKLGGG